MSPRRATDFVRAFGLPTEEEAIIIEADVRRHSLVDISRAHNLSVETVKRYRRRGYRKIVDEMQNARKEERP
jgi:DNA-directed RNA polymerase specialized sigma24 family protein